jgi:cytochrome c oxidase subunit 2
MSAVRRNATGLSRHAICVLLALLSAGCTGPQSALPGATAESLRVATLFWILFWGSALILALVLGLALVACLGPARLKAPLRREKLVIGGGLVLPIVVLSVLLWYGFVVHEADPEPGEEGLDALHISVIGEQWWWRVRYDHADGGVTETDNELRLPVGRSVELTLTTADVIHSFWIPAYAGKLDMVPGRVNTLRFTPRAAGIERGQCAEYCGGAHALMSLYAVAWPSGEFEIWLVAERGPARPAPGAPGGELFRAAGCGGCHTIRGSEADGTIGPDLTHVGTRLSVGAAVWLPGPWCWSTTPSAPTNAAWSPSGWRRSRSCAATS